MKYSQHSLAALALLCIQATAAAVEITIDQPIDGSDVATTLVVQGTSDLAVTVELQVDNEPFQTANGTDTWDVVLEPGSMSPGQHTLTARATDSVGAQAMASVSVNVIDLRTGTQRVTYTSSVDGVEMGMELFMPANLDPTAPTALVMYLHGGGGDGVIPPALQPGLSERNWIAIAPDGRLWGLANQGCIWRTSAGYVDSFDPNVGPGEQDMLDAIDWATANLNIDPDRIYLTGHSMGGRGTYIIGLKNPDLFAAIAPLAPAIDMYEVFVRRPEPAACKEGMTGGQPQDSPLVDTMYTITSGRFLIENAYNLPVFHGHGLEDTVASNTPIESPFLHGWHITLDNTWDGCFIGTTDLCFGHTPTLQELNTNQPEGYDWAYLFTGAEHPIDSLWLDGTSATQGIFGVEDPQNPGQLLGAFDFFERRTLVRSPDTVVYKSYTDTHRKAYWAEIDVTQPWLNIPGAIRTTRDIAANTLAAELSRVAAAHFDLALAELTLTDNRSLTITVEPLQEPTYDPALASTDPLNPAIVLKGDFSMLAPVTVSRDNMPLDATLVEQTDTMITIGPIDVSAATTLVVGDPGNVNTNEPPIADAGMEQTVNEGDVVTLDGTASADPEGGTLIYLWSQTGGASVTLVDTDTATASFTAPPVDADDMLTFLLTVTDPDGLQDTASVTVNVLDVAANQPPIADAGQDITVNENDTVMLSGDNSSDPENEPLTFSWMQIAGPTVTLSGADSANAQFTAPVVNADETLSFELTVTDSEGQQASDTVNVLVNNDPQNLPPTANAGIDQNVTEGDAVTLSGAGSGDPENQPLTYAWSQTSGPLVTLDAVDTAMVGFAAPQVNATQTLTFMLTVTDSEGLQDSDSVSVIVNDASSANLPPVADAGPDQIVAENAVVTLSGANSTDPEGQPLGYMWMQTAGPTVNLNNADTVSPSFMSPTVISDTTLTFFLTVIDSGNLATSDTVNITVTNGALNQAPIARAGQDRDVTENERIFLDATDSEDPEGSELDYLWQQTDGPEIILEDAESATPNFIAPEVDVDMQLAFQVTVTDANGLSSTDDVNVRIKNRSLLEEIGGAGANGPLTLLLMVIAVAARRLLRSRR